MTTPILQLRLVPTTRNGGITSPLTTLKHNSDFDLVLTVKDLRPAATYTWNGKPKSRPRGVFAAYTYFSYDTPGLLIMNGGIFPSAYFKEGLIIQQINAAMFKVGAFSNSISPTTPNEVAMFRFQMRIGEIFDPSIYIHFELQASIERPIYAPLVYGIAPDIVRDLGLPTSEIGAVKDDELKLVNGALRVTQ
jgi:hypothetical protein